MNLKGIKRVRDGQFLMSSVIDDFDTDRKNAYRWRSDADAIEHAKGFAEGSVIVVDMDDSDRQIWPAVSGIQWTELRYPCNDPENGPARRNPINGCITCGSKEADGYDDNGECFSCNDRALPAADTPAPTPIPALAAVKPKRAKPKSRTKRWEDAAIRAESLLSDLQSALEELADVKSEYEEWRDNLPENLQNSALGEKLNAVADLEFGDLLDDADTAIQEAVNADLPLGFGRD